MTEKRFRYCEEENGEFPFPYIKDSDGKDIISLYQCYECMNALHEENEQLKNEIEKIAYANEDLLKEKMLWKKLSDEYAKLYEENEQLKQRNENQYNQLNELWQIIEEENWEKLIAMNKQLKEDEERLQKEWKCYE